MKSFICIAILVIATACSTEHGVKTDNVPSAAQLTDFLHVIDARGDGITSWNEVRAEALSHGINDQISVETWHRLLEASTKSGIPSRIAVQLHPVCRQRPYFDEMVHRLGYDSDLFTRARILDFMIESYPEDPRTPKYGLLLMLDCWNEQWSGGVSLHGNTPRGVVESILMNEWEGLSYGDFTPEKCGQLLAQSNKWVFNKSDSKWHVSPSQ